MPQRLNTEIFIKKSKSKFGDCLDYSLVNYKSSRIAVILICSIHGQFEQNPNTHLHSKLPCPDCSNKIPTTKQFIEKAISVHGDKFDYTNCNYLSSKTKVEIICKIHGSFFVQPLDHFEYKTGGCALCAGNIKLTTEEFITKAVRIYGDKYDYSLVNYNGNLKKVKIICKIHGIFKQTPSNHYKYGCLTCSGNYLKTTEWFVQEATIIHHNKYDYSQVNYLGMFNKVKIICPQHGEFWQLPTNHLHGARACSKCSKRISKAEILWLNSIGIPNDKEHRNVYIKVGPKRYFVDGFDPIKNIIYEFNGDYWHGNPAIYNENDINPEAKVSFGKLWQRTLNKRYNLESAGYAVISIWESEFNNL